MEKSTFSFPLLYKALKCKSQKPESLYSKPCSILKTNDVLQIFARFASGIEHCANFCALLYTVYSIQKWYLTYIYINIFTCCEDISFLSKQYPWFASVFRFCDNFRGEIIRILFLHWSICHIFEIGFFCSCSNV